MNARSIALAVTFAAIAIALNTIRIPTIYLPGFSYHFNEIPIVVTFILFGPQIGFLVGVLHLAGQELLFPIGPPGIVAYPMGFLALLVMVAGAYLANRLIAHKSKFDNPLNDEKRAIWMTAGASISRGGIMPIVEYFVLYGVLFPLVLGTDIPRTYAAGLVPSFILYNVTVALYTVPIAWLLAAKVSNQIRLNPNFRR
jgi:riboflavin transporter FmnP